MGTYNRLLNNVNPDRDDELAEQGPALQLKPGQSTPKPRDVADALKESLNNLFSSTSFKPF
jgi:hypothetical protein